MSFDDPCRAAGRRILATMTALSVTMDDVERRPDELAGVP